MGVCSPITYRSIGALMSKIAATLLDNAHRVWYNLAVVKSPKETI